jgi:hypothetical protein
VFGQSLLRIMGARGVHGASIAVHLGDTGSEEPNEVPDGSPPSLFRLNRLPTVRHHLRGAHPVQPPRTCYGQGIEEAGPNECPMKII